MSIWDILDAIPRRGDVSPEELAARRQGYADLYAGGFLSRNSDQMPLSVQGAQAAQDFIPGIGDAIAFGEAGQALSEGDRRAAALLAAGGLLGVVPGAGDALARPIMAAGRRAADIARRIEVDPNALGSMGGNVRLRPQAASDADEITLFHGSPYDFRSFDEAQIGRGEGAQDLGRGFSLTDEEIVAHSYMNPASRWGDLEAMERYRQAGPGRTYQVGVKARPDQILDWKKPWREQVPEGTPLYDKIQESMAKSYADDPEMQKLFQQANLSSAWRDDFGMEDAALKSGFVGNKRQNFSGDTEFTVFDPTRMEIKNVFDNEGRELPFAPPSPAREVAGLLSSGRANEVTDEMLAKFAPKDEMEMFDLYQRGATGMDLPMDEASRMARASHFSPALHGTGADITAVDPSFFGNGQDLLGTGFYTTTAPSRADRYVPKEKTSGIEASKEYAEGGNVIPLMVREDSPFMLDEPLGDAAKEIADIYADDPFFKVDRMSSGVNVVKDADGNSVMLDPYQQRHWALQNMRKAYGPQDTSGVLSEAGYSGVSGPESSGNRVRLAYDPSSIRSRFARFDPRLAHLRHLSAAIPAAGLLSTMMPQEEQY